ncbi:MAG: ABC transporter permease subunit [Opitutales bacterium]
MTPPESEQRTDRPGNGRDPAVDAERLRRANRVDAWVRRIIRAVGSLLLLTLLGILVFLVVQVLPLVTGPTIGRFTPHDPAPVPPAAEPTWLLPEGWEAPIPFGPSGRIRLPDAEGPAFVRPASQPRLVDGQYRVDTRGSWLWFLAENGRFEGYALERLLAARPVQPVGGDTRTLAPDVRLPVFPGGVIPHGFALSRSEDTWRLLAWGASRAWLWSSDRPAIWLSLNGKLPDGTTPHVYRLSGRTGLILAFTGDGRVSQRRLPAEGRETGWTDPIPILPPGEALADAKLLAGERTFAVLGNRGTVRLVSWLAAGGFAAAEPRSVSWLRSPPAADAPVSGQVLPSPVDRRFLVMLGDRAALILATGGLIRWQGDLPAGTHQVLADGDFQQLFAVTGSGPSHSLSVRDPHAAGAWPLLVFPQHYEGRSKAEWVWQSTGSQENYEPKVSFVPLLVGSLKGTLFGLIFALPIALSAAVFASQFLPPQWRSWIKPTMELMASVPSVVLGFIGAVWLAPRIGPHVPAFLLALLLVPVGTLLTGWLLSRAPRWGPRLRSGPGMLMVACLLAPVLAWIGWRSGLVLEQWLFVVEPGLPGDFRLWWETHFDLPVDQRNGLVVGFVLAFAVIPILFTLADEAFINVPRGLIQGSLALGASRWQTFRRIVLPAASGGVISALLLGFGRALGETMIVLMISGNAPLTSFSPLLGMRTVSANLAIELPEAAAGSTLFRVLFLSALVLLVFSFLVNSLAEWLRIQLRRRYRTYEARL